MPPEVVKRATELFFTTKEIGKGTGMGLSQVYGTIKQFGGELTIETELGKGTAISLFLSAQESDPKDTQETEWGSVHDTEKIVR